MKRYELNSIEWQALADWFMYHIKPEERESFGANYPAIYNKLCGTEIVRVVGVQKGDTWTNKS